MKKRVSVAGLVPVLAVAMTMVACSHNRTSEEKQNTQQQPGQSGQAQGSQAQGASAAQSQAKSKMMLGEEHVSEDSAQIQRQKKVVSTVIVKEKIPTVKEQTIRADINRMDAKQFTAIGFPNDISQSIVQYRDRNGPFQNVKDLSNVEGVSQAMLDKFDGTLGVSRSAAGISGQQQSNQQQPSQQLSGQQQSESSSWNQ